MKQLCRLVLTATLASAVATLAINPVAHAATSRKTSGSSKKKESGSSEKKKKSDAPTDKKPQKDRATDVARSDDGRIARSTAAKDTFMRQTGYPHGRPGYVVDHVVPLACRGADAPSNMQWQTVADAKAKDRVERVNCR